MFIGSVILSIFNALFYIVSIEQRLKVIRKRLFVVYLPCAFVIFFGIFDAIWLFIHGVDFMMAGFSATFYLIMSLAFIGLVLLQASSFFLMIKRGAEIASGGEIGQLLQK